MADDPITVSAATEVNVRPGLKFIALTCAGPADYDATGGALLDLSDYFNTTIYTVDCNSVDAEGDDLWKVTYANTDYTDLDGGYVHFAGTQHGTSGEGESLIDSADAGNLSGIVFKICAWGY